MQILKDQFCKTESFSFGPYEQGDEDRFSWSWRVCSRRSTREVWLAGTELAGKFILQGFKSYA